MGEKVRKRNGAARLVGLDFDVLCALESKRDWAS